MTDEATHENSNLETILLEHGIDKSNLDDLKVELDKWLRNRQAAFLHDNGAGTFRVISEFARLAQEKMSGDDSLLNRIQKIAQEAESQFRRFEMEARPMSHFTFSESIRHVRSLAQSAGREIDLQAVGDYSRLSDEKREDLLQTLRELVRNAYRHGKGRIDALVKIGESKARVEVSDQGPGIEDEENALEYCRARASRHGGTIEISSDPATVRWTIPIFS